MVRPQIAVFGESLVDVMRRQGGTTARPGGSPLNVAVGLARLGATVDFATSIGCDGYGDTLVHHLHSSGVRLAAGSVHSGRSSSARASIAVDGSASYEFEIEWDPRVTPSSTAPIGHFGSISAVLEPGASRVLKWASTLPGHAIVSFDPNVRPSISGTGPALADAVHRGAEVADLIKLSAEDLELLAEPGLPRRWLQQRTSLVVVTNGSQGATLLTAEGRREIPAPSVDVVDTVGAGDSFMSGLLFSLSSSRLLDARALKRASLRELTSHVEFAIRCAAVTVGRDGADPPGPDEVPRAREAPHSS